MLCRRVLHLYKKYSEKVIVYAVAVHSTNISDINEVPSAKHGYTKKSTTMLSVVVELALQYLNLKATIL